MIKSNFIISALFSVATVSILSLCGCTALGDASASHDFTYRLHQQFEKQANDPEVWMGHYYQYPMPEKTPIMINMMIANHYFDQAQPHQAEIITAFYTQLFARYPNSIEIWVDQIRFGGEQSEKIIYKAIWNANTTQGKNYLKALARKANSHTAKIINTTTAYPPKNILTAKMSVDTLDQLWMSFFASGNVKYLKPIVRVATNTALQKHQQSEATILTSAARWSLTANGNQYFDLPCTYLKLARETNPNEAKFLRDLVKNVIFKDKSYVISCPNLPHGVIGTCIKDEVYNFDNLKNGLPYKEVNRQELLSKYTTISRGSP